MVMINLASKSVSQTFHKAHIRIKIRSPSISFPTDTPQQTHPDQPFNPTPEPSPRTQITIKRLHLNLDSPELLTHNERVHPVPYAVRNRQVTKRFRKTTHHLIGTIPIGDDAVNNEFSPRLVAVDIVMTDRLVRPLDAIDERSEQDGCLDDGVGSHIAGVSLQ